MYTHSKLVLRSTPAPTFCFLLLHDEIARIPYHTLWYTYSRPSNRCVSETEVQRERGWIHVTTELCNVTIEFFQTPVFGERRYPKLELLKK